MSVLEHENLINKTMSQLFTLFSHTLTEDQKKEAFEKLGVSDIVSLPDTLQKLWSQVPVDIKSIKIFAIPFTEWLSANAKQYDYILVQGDYGLTFYLVDFCLKNELIPVYSVTERKQTEEIKPDGSIETTRVFVHSGFRKYTAFKKTSKG